MDKKKNKSKRSAKKVVASMDDMFDQYMKHQETKLAESRKRKESRAKEILANIKIQQEEALVKFKKYERMTLGELKNVPFEDTEDTTTNSTPKNGSKSPEVKAAPSATKRGSDQSPSGPKRDETPTEPSQASGMNELVVSINAQWRKYKERAMKTKG